MSNLNGNQVIIELQSNSSKLVASHPVFCVIASQHQTITNKYIMGMESSPTRFASDDHTQCTGACSSPN